MATGPLVRREGLVAEVDGDGALIYDLGSDQAHWLDEHAAAVWRACDGRQDIDALAEMCELSATVVDDVLQRLAALDLVANAPAPAIVDRRSMLRTSAKTTVAFAAITTILAPTPAMAQSKKCMGGGGSGATSALGGLGTLCDASDATRQAAIDEANAKAAKAPPCQGTCKRDSTFTAKCDQRAAGARWDVNWKVTCTEPP